MCLSYLNFTVKRRNILPHCSLRGMICKSLNGSSRENCITFGKRTMQLSEQNTSSKHFHCNLACFEKASHLAMLLQYPRLHLQKLMLTQAQGCGFLSSPSLKQLSKFLTRGAQAEKFPTFKTELRELRKEARYGSTCSLRGTKRSFPAFFSYDRASKHLPGYSGLSRVITATWHKTHRANTNYLFGFPSGLKNQQPATKATTAPLPQQPHPN